jgi:serine/threonine protein kinase
MWSAPEILMEIPWNTAADIWSFGTVVRIHRSLYLFLHDDLTLLQANKPDLRRRLQSLSPEITSRPRRILLRRGNGDVPLLRTIPCIDSEVASEQTCRGIAWLIHEIPHDKLTPFACITEREVCKKDREFILKIMKLDYRDRPTAKEILADEWWDDDESNAS